MPSSEPLWYRCLQDFSKRLLTDISLVLNMKAREISLQYNDWGKTMTKITESISEETIKAMDIAMKNFKNGRVSEPIDLDVINVSNRLLQQNKEVYEKLAMSSYSDEKKIKEVAATLNLDGQKLSDSDLSMLQEN